MNPNLPQAKILEHANGLGAPDTDCVRRRAEELAEIDGRKVATQRDWQDAKRELHGGHENLNHNGNDEMAASVSERDMVAGSIGHHVRRMGMEDEDSVLEELYAEGMDEAEHEQMLESRRSLEEEEE